MVEQQLQHGRCDECGLDYNSIDYQVGLLGGYRWEFFNEEKRATRKLSPYPSMQHGFFYVAGKSNPHPNLSGAGEEPIYVGTLNFGVKF
jgi:hypothetical protein